MKHVSLPATVSGKVAVRAINFELDEDLQLATTEKAARLLRHNDKIDRVIIELENDHARDEEHQYVAKGRVDFGGPGLLASVTGADATRTLDYLIEQLDHQLRRQRRQLSGTGHAAAVRPASPPELPGTTRGAGAADSGIP